MYEDEWTMARGPVGAAPAQMGALPPQATLGGKAVLASPAGAAAVPAGAEAMTLPPTGASRPVLEMLRTALQALQLTCGISSELYLFPETRAMAGLREFHAQVLTPMSYHLMTAMGAGQIILAGNNRRSLWVLLIACIMAAEQISRAMPESIGRMQAGAPGGAIPQAGAKPSAANALQATQAWAARTMHALQRTLVSAQTVLGQRLWTDLTREAAELQRVRTTAY